jgi:hypothetical protein
MLALNTLAGIAATLAPTPHAIAAAIPTEPPSHPGKQAATQEATYPSQVSQGAVTLELEPQWDGSRLLIRIGATTHSGDLSEINLREQLRLVIGTDSLVPQEATALRGHHGRATATFRLGRRPERFTLLLRDVRDQPLRVLTWPPVARP